MNGPEPRYMLATGEAAAQRQHLIDKIFGPATREFLLACGLQSGCRVLEIGCGVGLVSFWMAEQGALVTGIDGSATQVEMAVKHAVQRGISNIEFRIANASDTGLPSESFDLVYSRFLMCHLPDPGQVLRDMRRMLKPGGVLACEDYDQRSVCSEPPSHCYARLNQISNAMDAAFGVDSANIGPRLPRLFLDAGFAAPQVAMRQNVYLRGEEKRLWELTLREARPAILQHGVATSEELNEICTEMRRIADDKTTLVMLARVTQVHARKEDTG